MKQLVVHTKFIAPRLHYIVVQLFEKWYGLKVDFIESQNIAPDEYALYNHEGLLLCSNKSKILFSTEIQHHVEFDWTKIRKFDFNVDWLGAAFFLLSRMEEYYTPKDDHGRFRYNISVAFQEGFLREPLVDKVVFQFVKQYFPEKISYFNKLQIIPTLDIDMTHAFLGRNVFRQCGAIVKDWLNGTVKERMNVLQEKEEDPYNNFDYQLEVLERNRLQAQYFFQVGRYGKFDKNISPSHPLFIEVLNRVKDCKIGLHPSYNTMITPKLLAQEKAILEKLIPHPVTVSRQHFLRFSLPDTYRSLINIGIKEEHSMGFSEITGFRAGTSRSFLWFDLGSNSVSNLLIQPFAVMDVALEYFQHYSVEQAILEIRTIKEELRILNGTFAFCFHNESLSERNQWKGWRVVFEEACKQNK